MRVSSYELEDALSEVAKKFKMEASIERLSKTANGTIQMAVKFRPSEVQNINPFVIGTLFEIKSRTYKVTGTDYGARKFKIRCIRRPDGRGFRVTPQSVIDGYLGVEGK